MFKISVINKSKKREIVEYSVVPISTAAALLSVKSEK